MRQLLGEKKVRRIREQTGLPVVKVLVRGNTDHRRDMHLETGEIISLFKDGTMQPWNVQAATYLDQNKPGWRQKQRMMDAPVGPKREAQLLAIAAQRHERFWLELGMGHLK